MKKDSLLSFSLIVLIVVNALMAVVNYREHSVMVEIASVVFCIGSACSLFVLKVLKKREIALLIITVILAWLFTYYFIHGTNDGNSCLWLLIFPFVAVSVVGMRYGIGMGGFFMVLLITFCWTPAKVLLEYEYNPFFLNRFPVLYTVSMAFAVWTSLQLQKAEQMQERRIEELDAAVKAERERNMKTAMQSIISISHAVDAKDPYTNEHSMRVAEYSRLIAEELGWDEEMKHSIYVASLIHDIGKIGVPDAVLKKPSHLSDEEYEVIKEHPEIGYGILKDFDAIERAMEGILYHHERYDGQGYPRHLKGDEIPLYGRIIAVADAFDAMNSDRVYRGAMSRQKIIEQLQSGSGNQFDPQFAKIMLKLIADGKIKVQSDKDTFSN